MDNLQSLQISSQQRCFYEKTQCFNICIKNFKENVLNPNEKNCLKLCLQKFKDAEKMYHKKLNQTMEYLALNDPSLREKFQSPQFAGTGK